MRLSTAWLAALIAIAACGDEDSTPQHYTASIDKTSTSADDSAAAPAPIIPDPADTARKPAPPQVTIPIALAPVGTRPLRGSGEVKAVGKSTSVSVALGGAVAGATYEGAVRQGTCASAGSSIASLYPVSADSLGVGEASSDVSIPIDSLTKAPHVVVYGRGGRPEACAPVRPAAAPPPSPTPPLPQPVDEPPYDTAGASARTPSRRP
jgi:hypothetical protein